VTATGQSSCNVSILCGNQTSSPYAALPEALAPYVNLTRYYESREMLGVGTGVGVGVGVGGASGGSGVSPLSASETAAFLFWEAHQEDSCYTAPFVRCR
jgi:hypothetical protein